MFSKSEKKIIKKIHKGYKKLHSVYMFWFVYDIDGQAVSWEGGWDLPTNISFRNDYSIENNRPIYRTLINRQ